MCATPAAWTSQRSRLTMRAPSALSMTTTGLLPTLVRTLILTRSVTRVRPGTRHRPRCPALAGRAGLSIPSPPPPAHTLERRQQASGLLCRSRTSSRRAVHAGKASRRHHGVRARHAGARRANPRRHRMGAPVDRGGPATISRKSSRPHIERARTTQAPSRSSMARACFCRCPRRTSAGTTRSAR